jgi:hypothetical protein
MKKISTAEAKPIRNFAEQKLTIGLDLGDGSSWYCVLDETGRVRLDCRNQAHLDMDAPDYQHTILSAPR